MPVESYEEVELLSDGTKTSQGFRLIKKEEDLVYRLLFRGSETQSELDKFSLVVPAEVHDLVAAWMKQTTPEHYRFTILFPESVAPDPVLLAEIGSMSGQWFNTQKVYIIARWGEALENFKLLHGRACAMANAIMKQRISMSRRKAQMELDALKEGDIPVEKLLEHARSDFYGEYRSVL